MRRRSNKIPVNVELETALNGRIETWAEEENRSKRNLLAVLARKLVTLKETNPDDLHRLGLIERCASVAR